MPYVRSIGVILGLFLAVGCNSQAVDPVVFLGNEESEDSRLVKMIWTHWMGKPELEYDRIDQSDLSDMVGQWIGTSAVSGNQTEFDVELKRNGTCESSVFLADGQQGQWRLSDGLILLYIERSDRRDECWSALFKKDSQLYLIVADVDSGVVPLEKTSGGSE